MQEIKVGDEYYELIRNSITRLIKIDRVTKTMAISKFTRFNRVQHDINDIYPKGVGSYTIVRYRKRTKELDAKFNRMKLINEVSNINWQDLNTDTISKIIKVAKENNQNKLK